MPSGIALCVACKQRPVIFQSTGVHGSHYRSSLCLCLLSDQAHICECSRDNSIANGVLVHNKGRYDLLVVQAGPK